MRTAIGVIALVAPAGSLALLLAGHAAAALTLFVAGGILVMTPILRPNVQWLGPVITRFETSRPEVWLTIDDGPTADTIDVLDLLARKGVRATFFVKGTLVSSDQIAKIVEGGHTIANHSHTHPSATFWCLPPGRIAAEVDGCAAVIPPTPLFRSPVGMKNPFVHPVLARRGMQLVGFSARAFDAVVRDPHRIAQTIADQVAPGGIIVLHQGRPWSLASIEATVDAVRARGFEFVIPGTETLRPA